jgi:hypothetical protein
VYANEVGLGRLVAGAQPLESFVRVIEDEPAQAR